MQRYEREVTVRTATNEQLVQRGDWISSDFVPAEQPLDEAVTTGLADSVAAAALAQEPGGEVVSVRIRCG